MLVWSFDGTVTFIDGTTKSLAILNDIGQGSRMVGDVDDYVMLLDRLSRDPAVKTLVEGLGYTPATGQQQADVRSIIFRAMAIVTDSGIYVAGSNTQLSNEAIIESNDLDAVLAVLNTDTDFVTLLTTGIGS
jgi:hypothetical protein